METRICKDCGETYPIEKFTLFNSGSRSLICNKCKNRVKHLRHKERMVTDPEYVKSQREKSSESYKRKMADPDKRLKLREKARKTQKDRRLNQISIDYSSYRDSLKRRDVNVTNKEIHHWNYNAMGDIFLIDFVAHKLIHHDIVFDKELGLFRHNGELLDTKEKHFYFLRDAFIKYGLNTLIEDYDLDRIKILDRSDFEKWYSDETTIEFQNQFVDLICRKIMAYDGQGIFLNENLSRIANIVFKHKDENK